MIKVVFGRDITIENLIILKYRYTVTAVRLRTIEAFMSCDSKIIYSRTTYNDCSCFKFEFIDKSVTVVSKIFM